MDGSPTIYEDRLAAQMDHGDFVLAVVTATKPDFYKQAPVVAAAKANDFPCFVIHTGQHYDDVLGHGLEEYGLEPHIAVDLGIRGDLSQKTAEMMLAVKELTTKLEEWPNTTVLPMVHGDTHAAAIFPQAWLFAMNQQVAHNEAGLRGMAPNYETITDPEAVIREQWNDEWHIERTEPFPEQYDTFIGSGASIYQFAPVELNRKHLEREGYPCEVDGQERIPVVGNSVVDAIEMKRDHDGESVFDVYPALEARDDWIRVDIHRRANLLPDRFTAIVEGVITLVERGYNVNFVELTATKQALHNYGYRERFQQLADERENFLFTGLWRKHAHVYEFLASGQCLVEFTDSGSMQEELNHIEETLCLTARFNTDRPETVFDANTNLLIPPTDGEFIADMIAHVAETDAIRERMHSGEKLYGGDVGERIIEFLETRDNDRVFDWTHERLGVGSEGDREFEYL